MSKYYYKILEISSGQWVHQDFARKKDARAYIDKYSSLIYKDLPLSILTGVLIHKSDYEIVRFNNY